ncbi:YbaK/prolyl-tRNA synthetase associated domain-containing protein [Burkholderia multivorans]|uniref:YbaK/EbsC family protein n=1 Tax=Burkholderia ubonensis TaxID=101571 RepID=UPI000F705DE7|nr:YbaK/EbsC family protein [Burkholderia ubonensis]AYZ62142.1 YbaK/prolyl-tRNA synthetase associated domain-containing protein [Burkholderia multivorans]
MSDEPRSPDHQANIMNVFWNIIELLDRSAIGFEFIPHIPEGRTDVASIVRRHELSEAAKSMLIEVRYSKKNEDKRYVLVVVPGNKRVDFKAVAMLMDGRNAQLATEGSVHSMMHCVPGAVPPFSFNSSVPVIADSSLLASSRMIFNAGRLDRSIAIKTKHYFDAFYFQCGLVSMQ